MNTLKNYWYLPIIAGLLGLSIFLYTHPQHAGPAPMSRQQVKRTTADVAHEQQAQASDQRAATWAEAAAAASSHNASTAAARATTLRTQTHPHAPDRLVAVTPRALRAADSLLANY